MASEQPDQLPFVIESLAEMNRFLQPDKTIRMILFLWSRFSPKCAELINSIPPECKRFFYYLNIDNPDMRSSILNSSSIKVTEVPCIIVVHTDGIVSTYEGDASMEIIKSVYSIVQKITQATQPSAVPVKNPGSTVTPLSEILGMPVNGSPSHDNEENEEYETDLSKLVDESSSRHSAVRSKVRQAGRPMDDHRQRIKEQDPPDVGLSSARSYPTKGVGHDGLARSSLGADIKRPSNKPKQKQMPISGGEMLDDELDDMLEEDATMDPIIRDVGKTGRTDKKEAMMNVKKAAEEMKRMREMEEEDDD
ncbi:MAG: hypothetical protein PHG66_00035 [Candidatus Colwellbacteria bacterium]|nr:hypothetical protein [Candidatus Colwellbacteria bacterium]